MRPDKRDAAYLWDMLDAARSVLDFTAGVRFEQYLQDRKLQLAVERCLEILGEAARNLSDSFKKAHPEIAWQGIIGLRHVLAHEYGEIKQDRIWLVVSKRVPELIAKLEPFIPPIPPEA
ncbi:MAG: DUF86 domain-containing protein [Nitrospirae bacterium]|nr:DUF86 domain-containing protein [Nitrospirota bacterium]